MVPPNKEVFLKLWPKRFIRFIAIIEIIAVVILVITELGNEAASFWTTNVFAGGWCGLVMLIHLIFMFMNGCCLPGPKSAFRTLIITFVGIVATALLISFDAVFIAQPTTCILTSSCATNAISNGTFTYSFQQSFFTVLTSWGPFTSYDQTQFKFLFQIIQLGVGCLCFLICVIYIIIYYVCAKKAKPKVKTTPTPEKKDNQASKQQDNQPSDQKSNTTPSPVQQVSPPPPPPQKGYPPQQSHPPPNQEGYYPPPPAQQGYYAPPPQQAYYPPPPQPPYYQPAAPVWPPPPPVPRAQPGAISWIAVRKY